MQVAFPHMGNSYIAFSAFIEALGWSPLIPDFPSDRTIGVGSKYSPEFVCLPFKMNIGDFINALEKGAKVLAMVHGVGPCRFNYYGELQEKILRNLGYDFEMIIFNQVSLVQIFQKLKAIFGSEKFFDRFVFAWRALLSKSKTIYLIEKMARETRCFEVHRGETTRTMNECLKILEQAKTMRQMKTAREEAIRRFSAIERDLSKRPLRVAILGEIYMCLEKNVNFNIEERLGDMGVYVFKPLSLYEWLVRAFDISLKRVMRLATPYLRYPTGGKDQQTVGYAIKCAKEGFDGVIHVYPFLCMPQVVARNALEAVSREYNIPVLNVPIDEHSSEIGFLTRLEAFIDMLWQRRKRGTSPFFSPGVGEVSQNRQMFVSRL